MRSVITYSKNEVVSWGKTMFTMVSFVRFYIKCDDVFGFSSSECVEVEYRHT